MHGVKRALAYRTALFAYFPDQERFGLISVPTVHDAGDVDVDDVTFFQRVVAWYPVADHVVNAGAATFRVPQVAERRWGMSVLDRVIVRQAIDFLGRYSRLDEWSQIVQELRVESTSGPHAVALRFCEL